MAFCNKFTLSYLLIKSLMCCVCLLLLPTFKKMITFLFPMILLGILINSFVTLFPNNFYLRFEL
jgi:hypothetical protein